MRRRSALAAAVGSVALVMSTGCARAPSPLAPRAGGSIGLPHRGVLTGAEELPRDGKGHTWLRGDDRHFGLPRFVHAIERAAESVALERPGARLRVGDLSVRSGGTLLPHLSHRTGRDADLLLYVTTLEGAPVDSPGFVHVGRDGLAWDPRGKRFLRFDVERTWLLVKHLVEDPEARIQWAFASRDVEAMLVEWARARGEPAETVARALDVMQQPKPGGIHDDHLHVRTACAPEDIATGCEPSGPVRAWLLPATGASATAITDALDVAPATDDAVLAALLLAPIDG